MQSKTIFTLLFVFALMGTKAQDLHSPAEILKIMEASDVLYTLNILEKPIIAQDQSANLNNGDIYRIEKDGNLTTKEIVLPEDAIELKSKAEKSFVEKDYAGARVHYEAIEKLAPEYSKMTTYIGQTYQLEGDDDTAVKYYQAAITKNYIDYLAHWFSGRVYLKKGAVDKGIAAYLVAHILNRNHPMIFTELQAALQKHKGLTLENWVFTPQTNVYEDKKGEVMIEYGEDWFAYAMVKAVWAFEPGYKKSMGVGAGDYSLTEEKEGLLSFYVMNEKNKSLKKEAYFIALDRALENQHFDEYALYEIMLVKIPMVGYQLPSELIKTISSYILESRCTPTKGAKKKKKKK